MPSNKKTSPSNKNTYKHSVNGSKSSGSQSTQASSDIKKDNLIFLKFWQAFCCFNETPYWIFPWTFPTLRPSVKGHQWMAPHASRISCIITLANMKHTLLALTLAITNHVMTDIEENFLFKKIFWAEFRNFIDVADQIFYQNGYLKLHFFLKVSWVRHLVTCFPISMPPINH